MRLLLVSLRLLSLALLVQTAVSTFGAAVETNAPRDWALGERVDLDILAPFPLTVFNPDQTEATRQAEAEKVLPVFRFQAAAAGDAESELRRSFAAARERFVALVEAVFQQRVLRVVGDLSDPRFAEAILVFRSGNPGFPLSTNLAELWALGDEGNVVLDDFTAKLRRFMTAYLRSERLPAGERLTPPNIRLILPGSEGRGAPASSGAVRATNISRASLYTVGRYRRELANVAPDEEKPVLDYVAGFLRPNCVFDEAATAAARDRRIQDLNVVERYDAGQAIVRRGEIVDARSKLALDALRARLEAERDGQEAARLRVDVEAMKKHAGQWKVAAESEQRKAVAVVTAAQEHVTTTERRNRRLMYGIAGVSLACVVFAGLWWRHRARQRRLELSPAWAVVPADGSTDEAGLWRERALAAEARAEKATAVLRTHLLPHMARWMMTELVQRLLTQRSVVRDDQHRAELEVAELAERLEKLQAPLEDRLRAYERRIAELETELAAKDEQNQELIRAKIESTRRQMEVERAADGSWN